MSARPRPAAIPAAGINPLFAYAATVTATAAASRIAAAATASRSPGRRPEPFICAETVSYTHLTLPTKA